MPVAGKDAVGAERALAQRITFMRAAIGDRENALVARNQQHLFAGSAENLASLRAKLARLDAARDHRQLLFERISLRKYVAVNPLSRSQVDDLNVWARAAA